MGKLTKEFRMNIHNRFDIEVVDVETGKIKQKARAFNVVCDNYFSPTYKDNIYSYIIYGDGSGTPSHTDSALFHRVGVCNRNMSAYDVQDRFVIDDSINGVWARRIKQVIPNTENVGTTITEVGLGVTDTVIVTHAMLQDMNGNPISIQHTSTDVINVYCTIYVHYAGQSGDVRLYLRLGNYSSWGSEWDSGGIIAWALGGKSSYDPSYNSSVRRDPSRLYSVLRFGQLNSANVVNVSGFSLSNKTITITFPQVSISQGNNKGCPFIAIAPSTLVNWAIILPGGTAFPFSRITGEVVGTGDGTKTRFSTAISMPYNATVYINGVAQASGVRVLKQPSHSYSRNTYLNPGDATCNHFLWWVFPESPEDILPSTRYWRDTTPNASASYILIEQHNAVKILCPEIGIYAIARSSGVNIYGSNDGVNWSPIPTGNLTGDDGHYKYYKADNTSGSSYFYPNDHDGCNIIFDTPPADGDVITIDYTTDFIPKDSDHVLDVELTFTFGEYQGE